MTNRSFYSDSIADFLDRPPDEILGLLTRASISVEASQRDAWLAQMSLLRRCLQEFRHRGKVYFEYVVPRLGRRIDTVLLIDHVLFILEFKVGESAFLASAIDQVWDYALDLKNFHESSHGIPIAPILIATNTNNVLTPLVSTRQADGILFPVRSSPDCMNRALVEILAFCKGRKLIATDWERGRYKPTPTIIEAAISLYGGHAVAELSRSDADKTSRTRTSDAIATIIRTARDQAKKVICFVTGVPGAGKTLVGLNIATEHIDKDSELYSVYLSGNGPLVAILQEALTRDKVRSEFEAGRKIKKGEARRPIESFIQNVHHFRDDCLRDLAPPPEHVAVFDEAQRAWSKEQTAAFMVRKKGRVGFNQSEPEFLISCLDRHKDWAVVVCLVGGGQEINTGEAGIGEWLNAVKRSFPHWEVFISPQLTDKEYATDDSLNELNKSSIVSFDKGLHLSVSMRSFRAETVSDFVKQLLDLNGEGASALLRGFEDRYPIVLTRSPAKAKRWLRDQARGTERYGLMVSSQAQRLKPLAIDVRSPVDPIHWFLNGKEDVRSSFYLEDVATEFHVQGLELDWGCVVWDGDFRYSAQGWGQFSFVGDRWQHIRKFERQAYLKNAYRVLLTRARQGMVIVVPEGDANDVTRDNAFYDPTYEYLRDVGLAEI
ncbi:MAG TPA: DUF2075 domain-containing protein [Rhodoferax sp.]|nr:DUF2075 domain-containing protein [Rhodoferax sp.]